MKSLAELQELRDRVRQNMGIRGNHSDDIHVVVGMATCGIAMGARQVLSAFVEEVAREHLENVTVSQTGCIGICQYEPVVEVTDKDQNKTTYVKMTPERAVKVVHQHLINGKVVEEYTIGSASR